MASNQTVFETVIRSPSGKIFGTTVRLTLLEGENGLVSVEPELEDLTLLVEPPSREEMEIELLRAKLAFAESKVARQVDYR